MAIVDQLRNSKLSLQGNKFNPKAGQADFGFPDFTGELSPELSKLHDEYSVNGDPSLRIVDYNRTALGGLTQLQTPTTLDELDRYAPQNTQAGTGGVVSQIYKSLSGRTYRDLGPQPGRY